MQVIDLPNLVDGPNGAAGLPPPDSRLSLPLQKARGVLLPEDGGPRETTDRDVPPGMPRGRVMWVSPWQGRWPADL